MNEISTNIKDRVLQLIDLKGDRREDFFKKSGMSYSNFKGKSKQASLSSDSLASISSIYPDASMRWLLLGEGEAIIRPSNNLNVLERPSKYSTKIEFQEVPIYDFEASASFQSSFSDFTVDEIKEIMVLPRLSKVDGGAYISGNSMEPVARHGDLVAYKELFDAPSSILWGEIYLVALNIEGEHYILLKYLYPSPLGSDFIRLVSENEAQHPAKEVPLKSIQAIAIVKAICSYRTHTAKAHTRTIQ